MQLKVGIKGKTNYSLSVTGAAKMFEHNVPEKITQECTGRLLGSELFFLYAKG